MPLERTVLVLREEGVLGVGVGVGVGVAGGIGVDGVGMDGCDIGVIRPVVTLGLAGVLLEFPGR